MSLIFMPILPMFWIMVVGLILAALLVHGGLLLRRRSVPWRWVTLLGVLRVIAVILFLMCLLRPIWTYPQRTPRKPGMVVMLDTSRGMGFNEAGAPDPRLADALKTMADQGLRAKLEQDFDVSWFAFDADARPLSRDDLTDLPTEGTTKDIGRSLTTAFDYEQLRQQIEARSGERQRVLLVTDGNDFGTRDLVEVAQELGLTAHVLPARDVPVQPPAPRLAAAGLQGPRSVMLGSEMRLRARLDIEGTGSGPIELVLLEDGQAVVSRRIEVTPDDHERRIELTHRPTVQGRKVYGLAVRPVAEGPTFDPVEPQTIHVDIVPAEQQVLLLEDTWRWDFRFLRRIFEGDPSFAFTAFVARRPGTYMQFVEPDRKVQLTSFPRSTGELEWFDTIILGDVNPRHWPGGLAAALHEMVVVRGKSLIVIAGAGLPRLLEVPEIEPLLPVRAGTGGTGSGYVAGPIDLAPTAAGTASAIFHTPEGRSFFDVFNDLPPMDQVYAPLRKQPAATLLLEAPSHANAYGSLIVMAEHTVGRGRVLYIGTDTLWKWQTMASRDESQRTPYQVFWQQALRAMAPQRSTDGLATLWLQADRSRYEASQPVRLRAEFEGRGTEQTGAVMEVTVTLPDGRTLPVSLQPELNDPGVATARFAATLPGSYSVAGRVVVDGRAIAESSTRFQVAAPPDVMSRRTVNHANLRRLTAATGGTIISPDQRDTWPTLEPGEQRFVEHHRTFDLWRNGLLLLLLTAVMGADWLIRLLRGFV